MKKGLGKILSFILAVVMLLGVVPVGGMFEAKASSIEWTGCGSNVEYFVGFNNGIGTLSIRGTGAVENNPTFQGASLVSNIIVEEGITGIGNEAFCALTNVTYVSLPKSLKWIGNEVFGNVNKLQSLYIPENVEHIGSGAFYGCSSLKGITIPDKVQEIGDGAFQNCKSLERVTIGENVRSIGYSAFNGCESLKEVTIPNNVQAIEAYTFLGCKSLEKVTIGENVKVIGTEAFKGCDSLKMTNFLGTADQWVNIDFGLTAMWTLGYAEPSNPINYSKNLYLNGVLAENIKLEDAVRINEGAFYNCNTLKSVAFAENTELTESRSFYGCDYLRRVYVNEDFEKFEENTFDDNTRLTDTYYAGTADQWVDIEFGDNPVWYSDNFRIGGELAEHIVFKTATHINPFAFGNCATVKTVTIESEIKDIGMSAFADCSNLESFVVPDGIEVIREGTFGFCEKLTTLTVPESVKEIKEYAFYGCAGLTDIYYPGTKYRWEKIEIGEGNEALAKATMHFGCEHKFRTTGIIAPDCQNFGYELFICELCGDIDKREIDKLPHMPVALPAVEATCSNEGLTEGVKCELCGEVLKAQTTIPKLAHKPAVMSAVAPTCTKTGLTQGSKCAVCGEILKAQKEVAKKPHSYTKVTVKATIKENGKIFEMCTVCGTKRNEASIASVKSVDIEYTSKTYTGKALKPHVTVRDSKGNVISSANYDVKYENNKNVGTATVTVTLKGNYSGSVKKTFKINPKGTSLSKLEAVKKGFKAKWKKQTTQTTGYEIQYSTSKKFTKKTTKTVKIKGTKTLNKTVSKLKANTKYYVRIRTYKTVGGSNYYSSWSKVKSVKTKK